jgi:hypothetical protein
MMKTVMMKENTIFVGWRKRGERWERKVIRLEQGKKYELRDEVAQEAVEGGLAVVV